MSKKEKDTNIKTLFVICSIFTAFTIILYFVKFNSSLSDNSSDWADFGSYISGVAAVIFPALNVWVFIVLTLSLQKSQDITHRNELEEIRRREHITIINNAFVAFDNALADSYIQRQNPDKRSLDISRVDLAFIKLHDLAELSVFDKSNEQYIESITMQLSYLKRIYSSNSYIDNSNTKESIEEIKSKLLESRTKLRINILRNIDELN